MSNVLKGFGLYFITRLSLFVVGSALSSVYLRWNFLPVLFNFIPFVEAILIIVGVLVMIYIIKTLFSAEDYIKKGLYALGISFASVFAVGMIALISSTAFSLMGFDFATTYEYFPFVGFGIVSFILKLFRSIIIAVLVPSIAMIVVKLHDQYREDSTKRGKPLSV